MYPDYSRLERVADGSMHAIGLLGATCGGALLLVWASRVASPWEMTAIAIYAVTLIATFAASAFYHMTPWESLRPALRRIDHAAIYLKIAGTYTPLVVHDRQWPVRTLSLGVVWLLAIIGITLQALVLERARPHGPGALPDHGLDEHLLFWTSWSQVPFGFISRRRIALHRGRDFLTPPDAEIRNRHIAWLRHARPPPAFFRGHSPSARHKHGLV